jgi:hypothetical protein
MSSGARTGVRYAVAALWQDDSMKKIRMRQPAGGYSACGLIRPYHQPLFVGAD